MVSARRGEKLARKIFSVVDLQDGESVEAATVAEIGSIKGSTLRAGAVSAAGAAAALATGTGVIGLGRRVRMGFVLTNRRIIFTAADQTTGKRLHTASETPRSSVARSPVRTKIYLSYDLLDRETGDPIVKVSFPLPAKAVGQQIADALPERVEAGPSTSTG